MDNWFVRFVADNVYNIQISALLTTLLISYLRDGIRVIIITLIKFINKCRYNNEKKITKYLKSRNLSTRVTKSTKKRFIYSNGIIKITYEKYTEEKIQP